MKVLIISGTFLPLAASRLRMAPSGAAYIAGAARQAGHEVEIFDCCGTEHTEQRLQASLAAFDPDVVGLSITFVTSNVIDRTAPFGTRYVDMRPQVKAITDTVKHHSGALIILGGAGFNYYARNWLAYLDLSYGIRGEGENAFPLFLKRLASKEDFADVPGMIIKKDSDISAQPRDWIKDLDSTAMPAYQLFDYDRYIEQHVAGAVFTKRGCAFRCTFCPHSSLEGRRYRLKSPQRVVAEIEYILSTTQSNRINFCDNSFNCPKPHAEAICREIIDQKLAIQWHSGAFKPLRMTPDFCRFAEGIGLHLRRPFDRVSVRHHAYPHEAGLCRGRCAKIAGQPASNRHPRRTVHYHRQPRGNAGNHRRNIGRNRCVPLGAEHLGQHRSFFMDPSSRGFGRGPERWAVERRWRIVRLRLTTCLPGCQQLTWSI